MVEWDEAGGRDWRERERLWREEFEAAKSRTAGLSVLRLTW